MQKLGNFSVSAIKSCFQPEGYFDIYNFNKATLAANNNLMAGRRKGSSEIGSKTRYEFEFSPVNGFLTSPDLLMTNCELKLSFDRASVKQALLR